MVQSLRQQLITYPDLFIEYFQSRNNYRREYLVRFNLIRIESIKTIYRTNVDFPIRSFQSSIHQKLLTLQSVTSCKDLATFSGSISHQPFCSSQP